MAVPVSIAKSRVQNHERNFTSAKLEILYSGNFFETICWEISWKPYAGKFLETICWENFWKLYAGNLLMETMCWESRDASGILKGVIMAKCYGIII